jgi:hypothetical protein
MRIHLTRTGSENSLFKSRTKKKRTKEKRKKKKKKGEMKGNGPSEMNHETKLCLLGGNWNSSSFHWNDSPYGSAHDDHIVFYHHPRR